MASVCYLFSLLLLSCADSGDVQTGGGGGSGDDDGRGSSTVGDCGDGDLNRGEECDDGNNFDGDGCSSTCALGASCGDGLRGRDEQCDDGNTSDGDGCSRACERENLSSGGGTCGNGVAEHGEECDGDDLSGDSCQSHGFSGGVLTCDAICKLETSRCVTGPGCGNGAVDGGEDCDGSNLNRSTCRGLGFSGGTLGCTGACDFDTTFCTSESGACGDGNIDTGETCDGDNVGGETCAGLGFGGGTLRCRADCFGFNRDGCVSAARCGDGVVNGGEDCDGGDLNHETCQTLGFVRGNLSCGSGCVFDTRACESGAGVCGDGTIDSGEVCDGIRLGGETCASQGFAGGELACAGDCGAFDTRGCSEGTAPATWTCDPAYYNADDGCDCGCGAADPDCADSTVASCEYCGLEGSCNAGPCPGAISPTNNARCDGSAGVCGDGLIGSGEACDGDNLAGATCESLDLGSGELACAVNCRSFDTGGCSGGTAPAGWTCDPTYYGTGDGCDCGCGAVDPDCATALVGACVYCDNIGSCSDTGCPGRINPTSNAGCVDGASCGNGVVDAGEACDGADLGPATCETLGFAGGDLGCAGDCVSFDTRACEGGEGVPAAWTCSDIWYGDGSDCDCGCGVLDPDCLSTTVASCDYCGLSGSCSDTSCPGDIDPASNWKCADAGASCGNGSVDPGETCDGANLDGESCISLGFSGGTLACAATCRAFNTSGCTGDAVPDTWFCSPSYYDAVDGCDCECGAYDPDCDDPSAVVYGCVIGDICDEDGFCAEGGSTCGDGVLDADETCDGDNLGEANCLDLGFSGGDLGCAPDCLDYDTGDCTGSSAPPGWLCPPGYYDAVDGCDCECGVYDPDCDDPDSVVYGCGIGESCGDDAHCTGGGTDCGNDEIDGDETCDGDDLGGQTCVGLGFSGGDLDCRVDCTALDTSGCTGGVIPPGWFCPESYYGEGDFCDCDCGAYDPDCDNPLLDVFGCDLGDTCDSGGNCVDGGGVPAEWSCEPSYYAADDGCDCECGAYDPDCDDPTATVWNCIPGQSCSPEGLCTGSGGGCGNGAIDSGETCDGTNLDGETCTSLGFTGGDLACAANCLSFNTAGCTGSSVPPGWTCNPGYYNTDDGCDCECGAYDPDCDDPEQEIYGCLDGEICNSDGTCAGGGGDVPPGWICPESFYGDFEYCDCDCGAYDPDCDDTGLPIAGCGLDETCDASGSCTGGGGGDVPPGWSCDPTFYDADDGCDCECGAYDLDCDDPLQDIYGCDEGEICDGSGSCAEEGGGAPPGWGCDPTFYDADDGCDCECGAYDPDCDDPLADVYGCEEGETCDFSGSCVDAGGAPPGWFCDEAYYDGDDGCDCECGAYDPDCDDSSQEIYGCEEGEICDFSGMCV